MTQILSNKDCWNIVKYEIGKRLGFPRDKFNKAWKSLEDLGYIKKNQIQGGWDYTIIENLSFTSTTDGMCESSTLTTGGKCEGGILTTINNNYYSKTTTGRDATCYESQFNELFELYPSLSTRSDGSTYMLKGKRDDCIRAYAEYLMKNEMGHEEILKALKYELSYKKMTGNIYFQPGLLKWIEDKNFEQYMGKTLETVDMGYGTELV